MMYIRYWLLAGLCLLAVVCHGQESVSRYDYSGAAREITAGLSSRYDQAQSIYRWLCDNIAYDTSFSIYHADDCWDRRKGVCQAYCELFEELGKAIGLDVRVITGRSKNLVTGEVNQEGHGWIFVVTEDDNSGVLIDPTWGAGSVTDRTFTKSEHDMSWFDVDPYLMICTHFPEDPIYQLLPSPVRWEEFEALPALNPHWELYGFDAKDVYERCKGGTTSLPQLFPGYSQDIQLLTIPLRGELRIGGTYRFKVKSPGGKSFSLVNGTDFTEAAEWVKEGDVYSIDFMPHDVDGVHLCVRQKDESYQAVVSYNVASPVESDWANVEKRDPFAMPEMRKLTNYQASVLKRCGVDGKELLGRVRKGEVASLPQLFEYDSFRFQIVGVPWQESLRVGQSYTFAIRADSGHKLAVVNLPDWHLNWQTDQEGVYRITVTPVHPGELKLCVKRGDERSFFPFIQYHVK